MNRKYGFQSCRVGARRGINLFLTLLLPFVARTQSNDYYIQLEDASGFNTAPYQDSLEAHAYALIQALPDTFRNLFRVYDFGFYQHHEVTSGYPYAFEKKKAEVAALTPYYLLFGTQTDKTGVYTKFYVDLKLPVGGKFSCMTTIQRQVLTLEIAQITNSYSGNATEYNLAEQSAIDSLRVRVLAIIECCVTNNKGGSSCTQCLELDEILMYLQETGFSNYGRCRIVPGATIPTTNPIGSGDYSNAIIADSAKLSIISPSDISEVHYFKHLAEIFLVHFTGSELSGARAIITKNESFCDNSFQALLDGLGGEPYIWWHIFDNPNVGENDFFFIKSNFRQNLPAKGQNTQDDEPDCNPGYFSRPCDSRLVKSGVFFVFGTNQTQTWAMDYNYDYEACGVKTTFQPVFTENIDSLSAKLASAQHTLISRQNMNKCFSWAGINGTYNDHSDRKRAAENLVAHVIANMPESEHNILNIPITLIGYSHGGNVALQAIPELYRLTGKKVNLITIATPSANHMPTDFTIINPDGSETRVQQTPERYAENPVNPIFDGCLGKHYQLWIDKDRTGGVGSWLLEGSDLTYNAQPIRTWNFKILPSSCVPDIPWYDPTKINNKHGFPYYLPCIKSNPTLFTTLPRQ